MVVKFLWLGLESQLCEEGLLEEKNFQEDWEAILMVFHADMEEMSLI